ncbi:hypothetical protein CPBF367_03480 [Xanthomonas arboricola pv. juglandis]|nr:hypothetical protein CPBF367_03480 [Xanthomonas arboricola pv. juglandis]
MAVNCCKRLRQTFVMPVRLAVTVCYALVELFQREMQDDGLVLHLCPARGAASTPGVIIKCIALDAGLGMCAAWLTRLVLGRHSHDQLTVAHADVELAADGEAQLFQPAAA